MTKLQNYLNDIKMSQVELARAIQVSQSMMSCICCGIRSGKIATWYKICQYLGVDLDMIYDPNDYKED